MQSQSVSSLISKTVTPAHGGANSGVDGLAGSNEAGQQDFSAILLAQLLGNSLPVATTDVLPAAGESVFLLNADDLKLESEGKPDVAEDGVLPVSLDASLFVLPPLPDRTVTASLAQDVSGARSGALLSGLEIDPLESSSNGAAEFAAGGKFFRDVSATATAKSLAPGEGNEILDAIPLPSTGRDDVETGKDASGIALAAVDLRLPDSSRSTLTTESQSISSPIGRLTVETPVIQSMESKSAALAVPQPVGHADWDDAFGKQVVWMVNQHQQVAEMKLNPPHLGPMEVRLTVQNDQVTALFTSHHASVREAIEAAMPRLREMFAESGMMLGNASVSPDSFSRQQAASQEQRSNSPSTSGSVLSSVPDEPVLQRGSFAFRPDSGGRLDFFV